MAKNKRVRSPLLVMELNVKMDLENIKDISMNVIMVLMQMRLLLFWRSLYGSSLMGD